jgi:hypothetical protein
MQDQRLKMNLLAAELESLARFVPRTSDELALWYARARRFRDEALLKSGLARDVPGFLWGYLDDADVRFDDETQEAQQSQKVQLLIRALRSGRMPQNREFDG